MGSCWICLIIREKGLLSHHSLSLARSLLCWHVGLLGGPKEGVKAYRWGYLLLFLYFVRVWNVYMNGDDGVSGP
jgi:hypothetical protein